MNKTLRFLIGFAMLMSCNILNSAGYQFSGKIENSKPTLIFLEQLSHSKVSTIDSTTVGTDGSFKLQGNLAEQGLYRLRMKGENEKFWMVCLDKGSKITAQLDANNYTKVTYSADPINDELQGMVQIMQKQQTELMQLEAQYKNMKESGAKQEDLDAIGGQMQQRSSIAEMHMQKLLGTSKNLIIKYYIFSLYLNSIMQGQAPPELVKKMEVFIEELNKKMPNSEYNKDFQKISSQFKASKDAASMSENAEKLTEIGADAPDFESPDKNGKKRKLSDLKGKVVLLDFWASWCRPCRMENPNVVAAYNKYKSKGFTVMSISQDNDKDRWLAAVVQDGLIWENHVSDLQGNNDASGKYAIKYIPTTFLIGKDGKIIAKNLRGEALEMELKKIYGF